MTIVVMGVTGAGKTTVGTLLAKQLGWEFVDADDFHPAANVEKMRQGLPLNDEDRQPWLERLRTEIGRQAENGVSVVMACSALKKQYRTLLAAVPGMQFVYLKGTLAEVAQRLSTRREHFADEKILAGQFADLEEPDEAIVIEIHSTPEKIVGEIRKKLGI